MKFILENSDETLTTHSGLGLIGLLLSKTKIKQRFNEICLPKIKSVPDIKHGDVVTSYLGLLCQGKNDYDHIESFRRDPFFRMALDLKQIPSSPTLRQRLNDLGQQKSSLSVLLEESADLLGKLDVTLTSVEVGEHEEKRCYLPLDIDVSPFDNSNTKKEGVSRTYKGCDGYAPMFAYLGQEGYGIHVQLREGKTHCQFDGDKFLAQSICYARRITSQALLVRMDAGNDSVDNLRVCLQQEYPVDLIIKRNPRKESAESWLMIAKQKGKCESPREGKNIYRGVIPVKLKGLENPINQVFEVTERTIDKHGQLLLVPDIEFDTYWTTLPDNPKEIIRLYRDHATCEQFHSELKTDLDLERFPSGKFATNELILHLGVLTYNLLRIIGQESLKTTDAPLKKKVFRRRIKTVIQNIITLAAKLVWHARRYRLRFGKYSPWFNTFNRLYSSFC
ncbi:MAG: IS1380 family transposase [Peptococcaceae bacterium]|nr:IS1380 family transposase [Peptococcaceae bacterium]